GRAGAPGGRTAGARRAPWPGRGAAAALSPAGAGVEHLDQVTGRKAAVLVELDGGARVACLLAHADSVSLMAELRGQPVRLAVRRAPLAGGAPEPSAYGMTAALDPETRSPLTEAAAQLAAGERQ